MKTGPAILLLALAISASSYAAVSATEDESLTKTGRALETLGGILQGKDIPLDTPEKLADAISALDLLQGSEQLIGEDASPYFFKKIRRVVENVAKAVVVSKAAGAVGGMIG